MTAARMKPINWTLTILTAIILGLTLAVLLWLRESTSRGIEAGISAAAQSFEPPQEFFFEPGEHRANFQAAEALAGAMLRNPVIREVIITKWMPSRRGAGTEIPIVPFDLAARRGAGWRDSLTGMRQVPIRSGNRTYGLLYLNVDRSALRSVDLAIAGLGAALAGALFLLVGRVHRQETVIVRAGAELAQRKRELIRIERLALAGQLSASLLHDLKKPVLNIRHRVADLRSDPPAPEALAAELALAEADLNLFFKMLSEMNIEKFVSSDKVGEEYVDVNAILTQAARLVHYERRDVELQEDYAADLPDLLAQPFRLVQLFSNLILNAYQAMHGTGSLTLASRAAEGGVEVRITDTGPGIPPEIQASIFDPFFTTKGEAEGTGLGLAISRLIVEDLKGRITVESAPGGPTTFVVWLPAQAHQAG